MAVINSVQTYWNRALRGYEPTRTRFFEGGIQTGCGPASSATGPFYCPRDRYVYIDLGFFDQLSSQLGARGGPLAEAYILAHEYGHHVQNLTGVLQNADRDTGWCRPDLVGDWKPDNPTRDAWFITTPLAANGQVTPLTTNGQRLGPWGRPQRGSFGSVGRNRLLGPSFQQ